jgi:hypothetical protein
MALVDLGPPCARDWVALLGGHRIELVRKPLQQRSAGVREAAYHAGIRPPR